MAQQHERALVLLLPTRSETPKADSLISILRERNCAIIGNKKRTLTVAEAETFYKEQDGTPEFGQLVSAITAGPIVALALELQGDVQSVQNLGEGFALPDIHVSLPECTARELKFFFPEVFPRETTFALVKPDAEGAGVRGDIILALEAKGFVVTAERVDKLNDDEVHAIFPDVTAQEMAFLVSQQSCMLAIEKPFAVGELVALAGPTDPGLAREVAPDSLRALYGTDAMKNAIAVSSSADEAGVQLAAAFGKHSFNRALDERTVAILLPDAAASGKVEVAVNALRTAGFKVLGTKDVPLEPSVAQRLLPGVDDALVSYAQSGSSTAICISRPHGVRTLQSLVGPPGKAVTSTLSSALGFENIIVNRSPVVCPANDSIAEYAVHTLFPELLELQTTLAIIKPDAVAAGVAEKILQCAVDAGFTVRARTSLTLPKFKAEAFYAEHKGKPFLPELVDFMSSGPCIALALSRPGAIPEWRALMGPTRTAVAREQAPMSLRALYGTNATKNATHGSDSPESARREIKFFFPTLSVEKLPKPDEVATIVKDALEPMLVNALTELCKAKPEDPVRWLGQYLLAHNPNKPKVAQYVIPVAHGPPVSKKIVPDLKVIDGLRKYFEQLDADQSGSLDLHEFRAAEVAKLGITLPDIDLVKAELFEQLDADKDARVSWAEFRSGLLERSADLCFDSRVSLYRKLYGQGAYKGARTATELIATFEEQKDVLTALFGEDLPKLMDVFKALDKDGSGSVTWDEFVERIEGAFRSRAPLAHQERIKKRAPPPLTAPPSAPPPPAFY